MKIGFIGFAWKLFQFFIVDFRVYDETRKSAIFSDRVNKSRLIVEQISQLNFTNVIFKKGHFVLLFYGLHIECFLLRLIKSIIKHKLD